MPNPPAAHFQPYGPVELMGTVSAAASLALDALLKKVESAAHRVWAGLRDLLEEQGGAWSDVWSAGHPNRNEGAAPGEYCLATRSRLHGLWPSAKLIFDIGQSGQELVIARRVFRTFTTPTTGAGTAEAGGQLFGSVAGNKAKVTFATGPGQRTFVRVTLISQTVERSKLRLDSSHRKGLFFLGDWHTHPEPCRFRRCRTSRASGKRSRNRPTI